MPYRVKAGLPHSVRAHLPDQYAWAALAGEDRRGEAAHRIAGPQ